MRSRQGPVRPAVTVLAAILAASLSRAEMVERLKAPVLTSVDGLVQVYANCPRDMREEYQQPVSKFASSLCDRLYSSFAERRRHFQHPGMLIFVGDVRTNIADVVSVPFEREGAKATRIYIPAPGHADLDQLRNAVVRAFFRAVRGEELDDAGVRKALLRAYPDVLADYRYEEMARWANGEKVDSDDEEMLKLCRSVLVPGEARPADILRFASRLYLYPAFYGTPFCGKCHCCDFRMAVDLAAKDPSVRIAALGKIQEVAAYGGGRGDKMLAASKAYSDFLLELARFDKPREKLLDMLDDADTKLNVAMEFAVDEARMRAEGRGLAE